MTTGQFEVDTAFLRQSNAALRQRLETLKNVHSALSDKMAEVGGMWEGPARDAFHQQFQSDCAEFSELCSQLGEVLDSLEHAAQEYDACDAGVRAIIDALNV